MSLIKHKKVELTELFYDLVYVYAISKITALIHHPHHGVVNGYAFFTFSIALIIYVNSWMVQSVFTNRFGKNSLTNMLFMFAQMMCILTSSTAVTTNWEEGFKHFILPVAIISILLLLQYAIVYLQTTNLADKLFIRQFFIILGFRSVALLISVFLPYHIGLIVAVLGIIITWILPSILVSPHNKIFNDTLTPLNFSHIVERLSLLVIITFGETIVNIASLFTHNTLSIDSMLIFVIVTSLFIIYITEIDHMLNVNTENISGNGTIYLHYPIFFGLSLITVASTFLGHHNSHPIFAIILLYLGIFLLITALLLHNHYNKVTHTFTIKLYTSQYSSILCGFLVSLLVSFNWHLIIIISCLTTLIMASYFVKFNITHNK